MKSYYRETAHMLIKNFIDKPSRPMYYIPTTMHEIHSSSDEIISLSAINNLQPKPSFIKFLKNLFKKPEEPKIIPSTIKPVGMPTIRSTPVTRDERFFTEHKTSFSSADCIITFNDIVIGEVQALYYNKIHCNMAKEYENFSSYCDSNLIPRYPVTIVLDYAVFDKSPIHNAFDTKEEVNITLSYEDEYGHTAIQSITNCIIIEDMSGLSLDTITLTGRMILAANDVTPMSKCN